MIEDNRHFLIANVEDKIKLANKTNRIKNTVFYTMQEQHVIEKFLKSNLIQQYLFCGGFSEAERQVLIVYPRQYEEDFAKRNLTNILKVIQIILPKELRGQYTHRDYLSALMKIGLGRERFGDILVFDDEAEVIVLKENAEYICESLKQFTRFKKSDINIISIGEMRKKEVSFEELKIVVASPRLDSFVAELANCSRSQAEEMLMAERVFINSEIESKPSKQVHVDDIVTIRGKGKFIVSEFQGENKKERKIYFIKKYQ